MQIRAFIHIMTQTDSLHSVHLRGESVDDLMDSLYDLSLDVDLRRKIEQELKDLGSVNA